MLPETQSDELRRMALIRRIVGMPAQQLARVESLLAEIVADRARTETEADDWVPLEDAAAAMGMTAGHLRRVCAHKHLFDGNARMIKSRPGKPTWWMRRTLDPRLIDLKPSA